jgi:HD-GYP domain-containing protein (c-di-GMP phosphodiesterase class II)
MNMRRTSMTNKQAIKILQEEKSWKIDDRKIDAFIMAIEALKTVEKLKENEDDGK